VRVVVTGGPGVGTTTLGGRLALHLACPHIESDSLQWLPTDPPDQRQRPLPERLALLAEAITPPNWVLSGSVIVSSLPTLDALGPPTTPSTLRKGSPW